MTSTSRISVDNIISGWLIIPSLPSYPCRVGLVELVEHHHWGAAVVVNKPPEVRCGAREWVRRHHEGGRPEEAVGECSVDVVTAFSLSGDKEGQGAVWWQDVHAAVFLTVPGHQRNAALLHIQVRSHRVQSLMEEEEFESEKDKNVQRR